MTIGKVMNRFALSLGKYAYKHNLTKSAYVGMANGIAAEMDALSVGFPKMNYAAGMTRALLPNTKEFFGKIFLAGNFVDKFYFRTPKPIYDNEEPIANRTGVQWFYQLKRPAEALNILKAFAKKESFGLTGKEIKFFKNDVLPLLPVNFTGNKLMMGKGINEESDLEFGLRLDAVSASSEAKQFLLTEALSRRLKEKIDALPVFLF